MHKGTTNSAGGSPFRKSEVRHLPERHMVGAVDLWQHDGKRTQCFEVAALGVGHPHDYLVAAVAAEQEAGRPPSAAATVSGTSSTVSP
jgi:hypothetical protein